MKKLSTLFIALTVAATSMAATPLAVNRTFASQGEIRNLNEMSMIKLDSKAEAVKTIDNTLVGDDADVAPDLTGQYLLMGYFRTTGTPTMRCTQTEIVPTGEDGKYTLKGFVYSDVDIPAYMKKETIGSSDYWCLTVDPGTVFFSLGDETYYLYPYFKYEDKYYYDDTAPLQWAVLSDGSLVYLYDGFLYGYEQNGGMYGGVYFAPEFLTPNGIMISEENEGNGTWGPVQYNVYAEMSEDKTTLTLGNLGGFPSFIDFEVDAKNLSAAAIEQLIFTYSTQDGSYPCYPTNSYNANGEVTDYILDAVLDEDEYGNSVMLIDGRWQVLCELGWLGYFMDTKITFDFNLLTGEKHPTGGESGVKDMTVDNANAPVVYYNLQGVRVANPAAGGIYIRQQGNKVAKVLVK